MIVNNLSKKINVFIVGAKCIGQYGGYETFVDKLTEIHSDSLNVQYYITTKKNGDGYMDEKKLTEVSYIENSLDNNIESFKYHNAIVFKISVPQIGSAQAIVYDLLAFNWCLKYIEGKKIDNAVIYVLACRIGPFFGGLVKKAHKLGCRVFINPDGQEWRRTKWSVPIRWYWKKSEKLMVKHSDVIVCDSVNIQNYIEEEYVKLNPLTTYIAYGADIKRSSLDNNDPKFIDWLCSKNIKPFNYYMCCGRFVPENSFETMIYEFMKSRTKRDFVIITTKNDDLLMNLEKKLHWISDKRIKFVGTVYDSELLKKIRENAYANIHGHTVGGTNPSLLEALASTDLNLLVDVGFNREVADNSALYWTKKDGDLSKLIDYVDEMEKTLRSNYGVEAKRRIASAFSWDFIGNEYLKLWIKQCWMDV